MSASFSDRPIAGRALRLHRRLPTESIRTACQIARSPACRAADLGAAAGGDRLTAADIRADAAPRGLGRADPSQAGCGGDYGLRIRLIVVAGWGEVVRSVPRARAAVGLSQVTVTSAWNPLNRPVPPENVSGPVNVREEMSTTWP